MQGRVIKIFSDFYYIDTPFGVIEAKLRSILKKRNEEVYTGDIVQLEQFDEKSMQAFISGIKSRTSFLSRPKAANITKIIIVSALKEPDLDFEQLDRYIAHAEYHKIEPLLCFNKEDILETDSLKETAENIYRKIGYQTITVSALKKTGIDELKQLIKGCTSVSAGASGAGKSSIINALLNKNIQKTAPVSIKTNKGAHTTRHTELICIDKDTYTADTPGFSRLKFDFLTSNEVQKLFAEFKQTELSCRYKNCLHTGEAGCSFENIIKTMAVSRYESYKKFVREAQEYEEEISNKSIKNEDTVKYNKNKIMAKISHKKRGLTRKTAKQNLNREEIDYE